MSNNRTNLPHATGVLGSPPPFIQRLQYGGTNPSARRISNQEARDRREKGLCYYCDDKFVPGHRCARP